MRNRNRILALFAALIWLALPALAQAEKRVALVIGNGSYKHAAALSNPANDATDMANKLTSLGFDVVRGINLDFDGMRGTLRDYIRKLDGADLALFYYAGHGLQVNGQNYLAPVDARLNTENDLDFEAIPIRVILSAMERNTKTNLVFLDACRDNPLAKNLARSMGTRALSVGQGLAKIGSGVGSLIAFATQPGNVALDGTGRNSPFTAALLEHLGTPGQDVSRDLIAVRRAVLAATNGRQVPWENSSLTGDVVLKAKEAPAAQAPSSSPSSSSLEITYWNSIKDSADKAYFEAYLAQYPKGTFAGLARVKIAEIERADASRAETVDEAKREETPAPAPETTAKASGDSEAAEDAKPADETALAAETEEEAVEPEQQEVAALQQPEPAVETDPEPPADPRQDRELVRSLQAELNRLGCPVGRADGIWGRKSELGLKNYAQNSGKQLASLDPSAELLETLKGEKARICPLVCGRNQEEKDGRCVTVRRTATTSPAAPPARTTTRRTTTAPTVTTTRPSTSGSSVSRAIRNSNICRVCKHRRRNEPFAKLCMSEAEWIRNVPANYICR